MRFYLGTHEPGWLKRPEMVGQVLAEGADGRPVETHGDVPLFISRHRLARILKKGHRLPKAVTRWALDSGGFTQLHPRFGKGSWSDIPESQYVDEVRQFSEEIGMMDWAAPQDWMCEPEVLARTAHDVPYLRAYLPPWDPKGAKQWQRFTMETPVMVLDQMVREHQLRTCENFARLIDAAPEIPWAPVLQGWTRRDYLRHVELYRGFGIDLTSDEWPVVGVGSVCRRAEEPGEGEVFLRLSMLFLELRQLGIENLHAFGFKTTGLVLAGPLLASADSLAWSQSASYAAKDMRELMGGGKQYSGALPGHADPGFVDPATRRKNRHKTCNNCIVYALLWRARLLWLLAHEGEEHFRHIERMHGIRERTQRHAYEHISQAPRREPAAPASMCVPNVEVSDRVYRQVEPTNPDLVSDGGESEEELRALVGQQLKLLKNPPSFLRSYL